MTTAMKKHTARQNATWRRSSDAFESLTTSWRRTSCRSRRQEREAGARAQEREALEQDRLAVRDEILGVPGVPPS